MTLGGQFKRNNMAVATFSVFVNHLLNHSIYYYNVMLNNCMKCQKLRLLG